MVEGLAEEYSEDDEIQAYCRAEHNSQIRWYVNGKEITELRGSRTFKMNAKRVNSSMSLPTVTVQCAEMVDGKLIGSKDAQAKWKRIISHLDHERENSNLSCSENNSNTTIYSNFICVILAFMSLSACVLFV